MNIGDLVTGGEIHIITDEIYKLASQCVFITAVRPGRVHELQGVRNEISGIVSKENRDVTD